MKKQDVKTIAQKPTLLTDAEISAVAGGAMHKCADGSDMLVANMDLGGGVIVIVSAGKGWHSSTITTH